MLFNTHEPWKFAFAQDSSSYSSSRGSVLEYIKKNYPSDSNIWGIIGVPFDNTSSYHPGSRFGPIVIREASYGFEKYNITFKCNLDTVFYDFGDLNVVNGNCKKTCKILEETVSELLVNKIKPLILGGEHSISLAPLKAIANFEKNKNLENITIVHFDAHMDIINEYQGEKCSHAAVMKRIHDLTPKKIIQIGIRSGSLEEVNFVKKQNNIETFTAEDVQNRFKVLEELLIAIDGPIYLSIDMDVFDPSYVPSIGNPIPCGISPKNLEKLLKILTRHNIIGFDLVEVATDKLGDISAITAAKIVYDFLSLVK